MQLNTYELRVHKRKLSHFVPIWLNFKLFLGDAYSMQVTRRKIQFSFFSLKYSIFRAVKFTSKLFGRALSRRIKATVLYATETGRSEQYAKQLVELLKHAFNAQVRS